MKKILLVEDDQVVAEGLKESLAPEGYSIDICADGITGYNNALSCGFDLILLDLILPDKNGMDICRDLRHNNIATPIIMLTSKKEEIDQILGLEIGADDYVTKPFSLKLLTAKINAVLRRKTAVITDPQMLKIGNIIIDFVKMEATNCGKDLKLSATEFKILKYFNQHEGEVISRDKFLDEVWGYDQYPTTRTVDNYILSLRKKIEEDPSNPLHLLTVYTIGYKFVR
jgi:DNA-binding response OmpR family regulator